MKQSESEYSSVISLVVTPAPSRSWVLSVWNVVPLALSVTVCACGGSQAPTAPTAPVTPATVTGLALTSTSLTVRVGETLDVTARALLSDGSSQEVTAQASWQSSNATIFVVASPGKVLAMAAGTADVRATYQGVSGQASIAVAPGVRAMSDQADDIGGPQVKFLYVVPADRQDRELDINGTLTRSIAAFQAWLRRESAGLQVRVDTRNGQLDIAMVRLSLTDAQVMSGGSRQRDLLERELINRGFNAPGKMYAAYYEGGHRSSCADAF